MFQAMPARKRLLFATLLLGVTASCASVSFERETLTSGTFESTGVAFTILSIDLPKSAIDIARENASDARQPNTPLPLYSLFANEPQPSTHHPTTHPLAKIPDYRIPIAPIARV